jgi:branched-subunit amino acid aminotransferase/4-amino-4-deoxychorismate lyase
VFFTNAVRGVVPIAELDGAMVPPHARTDEVTKRFSPGGGVTG